MGYGVEPLEVDFSISKDDKPKALAAIMELMSQVNELGRGGKYDNNGRKVSWFSFVNTEKVLKAKTFEEAMQAWGIPVGLDLDENVMYIDFNIDKLGQEEFLLKAIAPFVNDHSYIVMRGEDNITWKWYFKDGELHEQKRQYHPLKGINYAEHIFHLP